MYEERCRWCKGKFPEGWLSLDGFCSAWCEAEWRKANAEEVKP